MGTDVGAEDLTLFDTNQYRTTAKLLRERFVVPPFSILDTTQGYWQTRKRNWLSLGIESELGRDVWTFGSASATDEVSKKIRDVGHISIFDPVLCEIAYRWWSPTGGTILDPFAGGSVRGMVAAILGRQYIGVDLSEAQVAANYEQAERILPGIVDRDTWPAWNVGDALTDLPTGDVDMLFSCPPYGDLEVYSNDPRDLSNMNLAKFRTTYGAIIREAVARLRDDRFAVFVVGNYRDGRTTTLNDLAAMTVDAFAAAGCGYYSDIVLANVASTAAMRASATFAAGRKVIRRHQYVLVFVKGDWRRAAAAAEEER